MKEIIDYLREKANMNIMDGQRPSDAHWGAQEGVLITNREALQIADALEKASYPPIVRAVLATMEFLPENEIDFYWASVNVTGAVRTHEQKPVFVAGWWAPKTKVSCIQFELPVLGINDEAAENLLFHRTTNGWEWYGNPDKQNTEQHGK